MKFEIKKSSIQIIPEDDRDEVYLENVFNLKKEGDTAKITRVAPYGLPHAWAYAEIKSE